MLQKEKERKLLLLTMTDKIKTYLINDDCFKVLKKIKNETINMVFADPPYFLSNDGISCKGGKVVSVNKGEWDKSKGLKEIYKFNKKWIKECKRILKNEGTIFISGTYHNIYIVGSILLEEEFIILNNITWAKTNPPPNISCRYFTHSTETIIWAKKVKKQNIHIIII